MLLMVEASRNQVPELPLEVCVADTEGAIGYMIQQSLTNRLRKEGLDRCVVTVLTQVIVDKHDTAFFKSHKTYRAFFLPEKMRNGFVKKKAGISWRIVTGDIVGSLHRPIH